MTVEQVKAQKFDEIPFAPHWKKLIGAACCPTHLFLFGRGGSGKSGCALKFSDHLSTMGYKFLYAAGEQFGSPSFTKLLNEAQIKGNENFLIVQDFRPYDLSGFDFLVIDSKDSLKLSVEEFRVLKKTFPHISTIILSQGKRGGDFRGDETWRNEVDTMIHCDNGIARTNDKNRWGGNGELDIFSLN